MDPNTLIGGFQSGDEFLIEIDSDDSSSLIAWINGQGIVLPYGDERPVAHCKNTAHVDSEALMRSIERCKSLDDEAYIEDQDLHQFDAFLFPEQGQQTASPGPSRAPKREPTDHPALVGRPTKRPRRDAPPVSEAQPAARAQKRRRQTPAEEPRSVRARHDIVTNNNMPMNVSAIRPTANRSTNLPALRPADADPMPMSSTPHLNGSNLHGSIGNGASRRQFPQANVRFGNMDSAYGPASWGFSNGGLMLGDGMPTFPQVNSLVGNMSQTMGMPQNMGMPPIAPMPPMMNMPPQMNGGNQSFQMLDPRVHRQGNPAVHYQGHQGYRGHSYRLGHVPNNTTAHDNFMHGNGGSRHKRRN